MRSHTVTHNQEGGGMAERLERWTCNSEAPSSSPLRPLAGFVLGSPEFKSSATIACKISNWFASYQLEFLTILLFVSLSLKSLIRG